MADNTNAGNETKIQEFQEITGLPEAEARALLEAADWNIETATDLFYTQNEMDTDSPEISDQEASRPSTADPSASQNPPSGPVRGTGAAKPNSSRFQTFSDIRARAETDDEGEKKEDLFAGGEKSGIAVQKNADPIKAIFEKAARKQEFEPDSDEGSPQPEGRRSAFSGAGRTLGSEDTPTASNPEASRPAARAPRAPQRDEVARRELIFWKNGFSVGDGPLLSYDEPENKKILQLIESGRAPSSILNIEYGQKCEVVLSRRMDQIYTPPPKVRKPFEGRGNRLGSPTPGASSSSSQPPAAASPAPPAAAPPTATPIQVSETEPTTTLQIRLADGTRIRSRFNQSHTVGDVYNAVNATSRESNQRSYVLQTAFPDVKDLTDKTITLKDAGLLQCAIMQKWT